MRHVIGLVAVATVILIVNRAQAQSVSFDFEDGTDQGFGHKFGNDASEAFPNVSIGGSQRMDVLRNGDFQEADHGDGANPFLAAMNAAINNQSGYAISYDWYVDTSLSPGNYGTFLQLGTYINSGAGAYAQDFPGTGKDVELNGTQLASGQVFSGTVTETLTQKYGAITDPNFFGQTFMRLGVIMNGDGTSAKVYFDNITVAPVPEPASLAILGLGIPALAMRRRRA
jgi:hypothetical protein